MLGGPIFFATLTFLWATLHIYTVSKFCGFDALSPLTPEQMKLSVRLLIMAALYFAVDQTVLRDVPPSPPTTEQIFIQAMEKKGIMPMELRERLLKFCHDRLITPGVYDPRYMNGEDIFQKQTRFLDTVFRHSQTTPDRYTLQHKKLAQYLDSIYGSYQNAPETYIEWNTRLTRFLDWFDVSNFD